MKQETIEVALEVQHVTNRWYGLRLGRVFLGCVVTAPYDPSGDTPDPAAALPPLPSEAAELSRQGVPRSVRTL